MADDVILNGVLMTQSTGQKSTMPSVAPNGQLLVARTEGKPTELWCGTGVGVEPISSANNGTGYQIFDIVMKDHILSYEETKGFAQLGTYVYKDPVMGVRYGYPDFYQKLVDEYNAGTSAYMSSNINIVGSLIDNDGVLSGFSSTSWAVLPENFTPSTNNWAITVKFKTGTIGTAQNIVNSSSIAYQPFDIHIDANGNILSEGFVSNTSTVLYLITGTTVLTANTDYYVQLEYNSSAGYTLKLSTDGVTFTTEGTSAVTTPINGGNNIALGADFAAGGVYYGEAFTGSIDLNESYINIDGTRWWTGTNTCIQNSNKHRFYDIADKATFDNIFGITGECWYYGIDTTNERIFLPRSTRFKNGTSSDVGEYNPAGLPNIEGHIRKSNTLTAEEFFGECVNCDIGGAFSGEFGSQNQVSDASGVQTALTGLSFDASRSSSIYGNSTTVEYSSTKLIPYMCVGDTESSGAAIDVIDITTSENDTLPLGFSTYQGEGTQPSPAWLKSSGQWNSGEVYATFYNYYVPRIGNDFGAGKVVENTDPYTDYDLVINQTAQTFRLPLLDGSEDLPGNTRISFALPSTTGQQYTADYNGIVQFNATTTGANQYIRLYNENTRQISEMRTPTTNGGSVGFIDVKKGDTFTITADVISTVTALYLIKAQGNGSLYYKVANAVQNLELLDAGEVLTAVNTVSAKVDNTVHITEAYSNGTSGYNVYSNGYCEQWGEFTSSDMTVTFLKPFIDTNYNINVGNYDYTTPDDGTYTTVQWRDKTTSTVRFQATYGGGLYATTIDWCARGYIST